MTVKLAKFFSNTSSSSSSGGNNTSNNNNSNNTGSHTVLSHGNNKLLLQCSTVGSSTTFVTTTPAQPPPLPPPNATMKHQKYYEYQHHHQHNHHNHHNHHHHQQQHQLQQEQQQQQQQQHQQSTHNVFASYVSDYNNIVEDHELDEDDNMSVYSCGTSASASTMMMQRDHPYNNSQRPLLGERKPNKLQISKKKQSTSATGCMPALSALPAVKRTPPSSTLTAANTPLQLQPVTSYHGDVCAAQQQQQQQQYRAYISPYVQQQKRDSAKGLHGFNDFDALSQQYNQHLQSPHIGYPYGSPPSPTATSSDFVFDVFAQATSVATNTAGSAASSTTSSAASASSTSTSAGHGLGGRSDGGGGVGGVGVVGSIGPNATAGASNNCAVRPRYANISTYYNYNSNYNNILTPSAAQQPHAYRQDVDGDAVSAVDSYAKSITYFSTLPSNIDQQQQQRQQQQFGYMGKLSRFEDDFCSRRNVEFAAATTSASISTSTSLLPNISSNSTTTLPAAVVSGPFIFGIPPEQQTDYGSFPNGPMAVDGRPLNAQQTSAHQQQHPVINNDSIEHDDVYLRGADAQPRGLHSTPMTQQQQEQEQQQQQQQQQQQSMSDTSSDSGKGGKFLLRKRIHTSMPTTTANKDKQQQQQQQQKQKEQLQKAKKVQQQQQTTAATTRHKKTTIKCVLVGDGAVGKTNLILTYLENRFNPEHEPTASDIYNADVTVNDNPVHLTLCDTAGQDTLDPLRELCYPDSDVFLLCFSVVRPETFNAIKTKWAPKFVKMKAALLLVGTQADLRTQASVLKKLQTNGEKPISYADAWDLATTIGAKYIETSSATQDKVKEVFDTAIWDGLVPTTLPPTPPPFWKKLFCLV